MKAVWSTSFCIYSLFKLPIKDSLFLSLNILIKGKKSLKSDLHKSLQAKQVRKTYFVINIHSTVCTSLVLQKKSFLVHKNTNSTTKFSQYFSQAVSSSHHSKFLKHLFHSTTAWTCSQWERAQHFTIKLISNPNFPLRFSGAVSVIYFNVTRPLHVSRLCFNYSKCWKCNQRGEFCIPFPVHPSLALATIAKGF